MMVRRVSSLTSSGKCDSKWRAIGTPCLCCDCTRGTLLKPRKVQTAERNSCVEVQKLDAHQENERKPSPLWMIFKLTVDDCANPRL